MLKSISKVIVQPFFPFACVAVVALLIGGSLPSQSKLAVVSLLLGYILGFVAAILKCKELDRQIAFLLRRGMRPLSSKEKEGQA